jgi:hypothetical protein
VEVNGCTEEERRIDVKERYGLLLAAVAVIGLVFLVVAPFVQAGGWPTWNRLEGAWLRAQEGGANSLIVYSPKGLLAKKAAFRASFINPTPDVVPPGTSVTDYVGEAVMTGPSTIEATAYAYIMAPNPAGGRDVVALIIVGTSTATFVNEDLIEGFLSGAVYLGSQDGDGDLIPDPGEVPFMQTPPEAFTDKRTPMVP